MQIFMSLQTKSERVWKKEVELLYEAETTQKFNSNDFLKLFRHIKENQLFYRTYFKLGYDNQFQLEYYDIHQAKRILIIGILNTTLNFFRSGFNAIVKSEESCGRLSRDAGRNGRNNPCRISRTRFL